MIRAKHRRNRGFTLIEILAVLVIFAIASAIVLPQFGKRDDLKVASASRELVADLLYAQSQAIATGKIVYVRFDAAKSEYRLLASIDPPTPMQNPASRLPFETTVGAGPSKDVTLTLTGFDGHAALAFDANGAPYSYAGPGAPILPLDSGAIVMRCGEVSQTVSIQPVTGEIKIR